jgi:AraC-like DNA-binding protein/ligand-binding sensor protein
MNSECLNVDLQPVMESEVSITGHSELEPLFSKARQVLTLYDKAMDINVAILDKTGQAVKKMVNKKQVQLCELCKKHCYNPSEAKNGETYPCLDVHFDAFVEAQNTGKTQFYTCKVGFAYWTSPIYRNGQNVGALVAGNVLLCEREKAIEQFRTLCKDRATVEKFHKLLEKVPEKNDEKNKAMARLLSVCAEEVSERERDLGVKIRRMALNDEPEKKQAELDKNTKKKGSFRDKIDSEYPLEKERMLLAAFRRGDNETGGRILNELMDYTRAAFPGDLEIIRSRAIELVVLLSRAAAVSEASGNDTLWDVNNRYLKRIQESKTSEELIENLHLVSKNMAGKIFSFRGIRHASVLRKAERYIWENYTRKISLEEISKASGLSAPYFSIVFKEEMGENLSSYLNRLRVERAAAILTDTGKPLKTIARLCGFEDQSWFSKIFKNYTGFSPGKYREMM